MSDELRKQIYDNLNLKDTEKLVEIWQTNDRVEWSEAAFDAIKEILVQRLGELPLQSEPILKHDKQEIDDTYDESISVDKFIDPNNPPVFYKPKEILWINTWLNRISIAAVVITIIVSIPEVFGMQRIVLSYFMGNLQWNFVAWLIALILSGLAIALQCSIFYFSLKALASILKILMEMEFVSRTNK